MGEPESSSINAQSRSTSQFVVNGQSITYQTEVMAESLNFPWSLTFMPNNEILISEKSGQLKRLSSDNKIDSISGVPSVFFKSQGGLFDTLVDPDFANNQTIYLSYAGGTMEANATHIASAKLVDNQLTELKTIFQVTPDKKGPVHYGGKLAWMPDNTILLTTGDGFDYREKAQDKQNLLGKIIRINRDGSIPSDNPYASSQAYHPAIYSLGHRNPQGITYDNQNNRIVMHEHGPAGGDEINYIEAGKNYGWPVASHGKDYSGASISPFKTYQGMQDPLIHWTPSIAPSGLAVYAGEQFPEIQGSYLVGALAGKELRLVVKNDNQVVEQLSLLKELDQRIRDVRVDSKGIIYVLTDGESGQLIRISRN
ncbi:PQQ-dependent sugar dehydrogenase [Aliikangiella marina]|uniref:PQQ-dependent sugar dehydrogenase n=2 Tax=Aliikangiella marina TaxID=1712262 RepID=A0A545T7L1_9GAMM|nr:PQQ-dependent sugar dehydrogenase [Aliikangiella marina]